MSELPGSQRAVAVWQLVVATLLITIPALVILGWIRNIALLKTVFPGLTPMNPETALCFLAIGVLILLELFVRKSKLLTSITRLLGAVLFMLGAAMLLYYVVGIDLHADRLLFSSKLGINRMAVTTSVNLFLLGMCMVGGSTIVRLARYCYGAVFLVSTYAMLAYLYNFVGVYGQTLYNPMAIHTAFLFLVVSSYRLSGDRSWSRSMVQKLRERHLIIPTALTAVFLLTMVVVTGTALLVAAQSKKQSELRFDSRTTQITSSIDSRVNLYIAVSRGITGFFASSDSVSNDEWQSFISKLEVPTHYGGISGISFARTVTANEVADFPYPIYPSTNTPRHLPITYSTTFTNSTTTAFGFDYLSDPARRATIERAIADDEPRATPLIFGAVSKAPQFSVYFPLYGKESTSTGQGSFEGIGSISFRLDRIFPNLIDSNPLVDKDLSVTIIDTEKGTLLYAYPAALLAGRTTNLATSTHIMIGGRDWKITYGSNIGLNEAPTEHYAPFGIVILGFLLALLLTYLSYTYLSDHERDISAKNTQLRNIIAQLPFGFLLEDENRLVQYVNASLVKDFTPAGSMPLNASIGMDSREFMRSFKEELADSAGFIDRIDTIVRERLPVTGEKVRLAGTHVLMRDYVPLEDEGRYIGGIWTYKDITEQQRVEEMKSDFVSLVSHQLKTPVAQIKGYSENMLEGLTGPLNEKQQDYLHDMLAVANKNSRLIDDLLNVSRIERGLLKLNAETLDLTTLLNDVLGPLHAVAEHKGVTLTSSLSATPVAVTADPVKTIEALRNIVDNAIKFTEPGKSVTLATAEEDGFAIVTIRDEGTGIDQGVQTELFEKNRVWSGKVKAAGAGLGLFLSKQFIELAGGTISFTTAAGAGTTFTIRLPKA